MDFKTKNNQERIEFIDQWSTYILEHDDKTWSHQQNIIINSNLKKPTITKEQYLELKKQ